MGEQDLSKIERLLLLNQLAIIEKLDPGQAAYCQQMRQILENGYAAEYGRLTDGLMEELSSEDCKEVWDILDMYRALRDAYGRLHPEFKDNDVNFPGFDANSEGAQLQYAKFLLSTDRWTDILASNELNTHWPMLPRYRASLQRWRASANRLSLTLEDFVEIVSAGKETGERELPL